MPMSTGVPGVPGDCCTCGRKKSATHCPKCGSVRISSYKRWAEVEDPYQPGVMTTALNVRHCPRCNTNFTSHHECKAPPLVESVSRAEVREARIIKTAIVATKVLDKMKAKGAIGDNGECLPLDPNIWEQVKEVNPDGYVFEDGKKKSLEEFMQGQFFEEFFELNEAKVAPVTTLQEWVRIRSSKIDFTGYSIDEWKLAHPSDAPTSLPEENQNEAE